MLDLVQIAATGASTVLLILVLELVRRRLLGEEYAFVWIVGALTMLVFSLWRRGLDQAAEWLGIRYGPSLILMLLVFFVSSALLFFSVVVSKQRAQIDRLIEDAAILDARFREFTSLQDRSDAEDESRPSTDS